MPKSPTAQRTLQLGRWTMAVSLACLLAGTVVAYPLSSHFGLGAQIAGHLVMPVAAALFKLGYVTRLAAHHALGNFRAG